MSCIIDNGYNLGCSTVGGIKTVYIGTFDPDVTYTLDVDNTITALNANPNTFTVYNFQQDDEYAGLEQTIPVSRENGTVYCETVVSMKFIEMDAALRNQVLALAQAPVTIIVEANTGEFYLCGYENAGRLSEGNSSLGTALSDMNGATLSFTFKSQEGYYLLDGSILVAAADTPTATDIVVAATT